MKSSSFISTLPIVSISEGEQIVTIQSPVVSRGSKKVEFFTIAGCCGNIVPHMLAFKDIVGIGNDYVVIQARKDIKKLYESQELIAAAEAGVLLVGATVLSTTGDILAKIADYTIDEKSGVITALTLADGQEIAGDKMVSISAKFVVVNLLEASEAKAGAAEAEEEAPEAGAEAEPDENVAFLMGKVVNSDVASEDGAFIIPAGTELTAELIERGLMLQLTIAV